MAALYWIPGLRRGRLAILGRPRAGDWLPDDVSAWVAHGLTGVVSLLEDEETRDLGLTGEAQAVVQAGLSFESFPIPDRGVPRSAAAATALWSRIAQQLEAGGRVGLHCRAGIGRSGLMAAGMLCHLGEEAAIAWDRVAKARGLSVPDTEQQRLWLDEMLRERRLHQGR